MLSTNTIVLWISAGFLVTLAVYSSTATQQGKTYILQAQDVFDTVVLPASAQEFPPENSTVHALDTTTEPPKSRPWTRRNITISDHIDIVPNVVKNSGPCTFGVAALLRNENHALLEWLEHYRGEVGDC
jgi:hypothetical protein